MSDIARDAVFVQSQEMPEGASIVKGDQSCFIIKYKNYLPKFIIFL